MNKKNCQVCGEGQVSSNVEEREVTYRDVSGTIEMHFATCDTCGSDFAGEEEARANKRAMISFHKEVDGVLAGSAIKAIRHKHEITQQQAAMLFGGGAVAFSKYENDDIVQNTSMNRLLRVADEVPEAFNWLNKHYGSPDIKNAETISGSSVEANKWNNGVHLAVLINDVRSLTPPSTGGDSANNWENQEELKFANG